MGSRADEDSIAHELYRILRDCDELDVDVIFSESFSTPRIGQAIMNRMLKAAGHQVIDTHVKYDKSFCRTDRHMQGTDGKGHHERLCTQGADGD